MLYRVQLSRVERWAAEVMLSADSWEEAKLMASVSVTPEEWKLQEGALEVVGVERA